jgi:hypothetical protein
MSASEQARGGLAIEVVAKATRRRVHGRVQAEDRSGGRRVQDARRGRSVARSGGAVFLAPHDVAWGTDRGELAGAPKKRGPVRRVADPRDK